MPKSPNRHRRQEVRREDVRTIIATVQGMAKVVERSIREQTVTEREIHDLNTMIHSHQLLRYDQGTAGRRPSDGLNQSSTARTAGDADEYVPSADVSDAEDLVAADPITSEVYEFLAASSAALATAVAEREQASVEGGHLFPSTLSPSSPRELLHTSQRRASAVEEDENYHRSPSKSSAGTAERALAASPSYNTKKSPQQSPASATAAAAVVVAAGSGSDGASSPSQRVCETLPMSLEDMLDIVQTMERVGRSQLQHAVELSSAATGASSADAYASAYSLQRDDDVYSADFVGGFSSSPSPTRQSARGHHKGRGPVPPAVASSVHCFTECIDSIIRVILLGSPATNTDLFMNPSHLSLDPMKDRSGSAMNREPTHAVACPFQSFSAQVWRPARATSATWASKSSSGTAKAADSSARYCPTRVPFCAAVAENDSGDTGNKFNYNNYNDKVGATISPHLVVAPLEVHTHLLRRCKTQILVLRLWAAALKAATSLLREAGRSGLQVASVLVEGLQKVVSLWQLVVTLRCGGCWGLEAESSSGGGGGGGGPSTRLPQSHLPQSTELRDAAHVATALRLQLATQASRFLQTVVVVLRRLQEHAKDDYEYRHSQRPSAEQEADTLSVVDIVPILTAAAVSGRGPKSAPNQYGNSASPLSSRSISTGVTPQPQASVTTPFSAPLHVLTEMVLLAQERRALLLSAMPRPAVLGEVPLVDVDCAIRLTPPPPFDSARPSGKTTTANSSKTLILGIHLA